MVVGVVGCLGLLLARFDVVCYFLPFVGFGLVGVCGLLLRFGWILRLRVGCVGFSGLVFDLAGVSCI